MSTKSTVFLTEDNEHCYTDSSEPAFEGGRYIGNTLVIEFAKKNIEVECDDDEDLILKIKPGAEIYKRLMELKWTK